MRGGAAKGGASGPNDPGAVGLAGRGLAGRASDAVMRGEVTIGAARGGGGASIAAGTGIGSGSAARGTDAGAAWLTGATPTENTVRHTEQRARTPPGGTFAGSTRNTV